MNFQQKCPGPPPGHFCWNLAADGKDAMHSANRLRSVFYFLVTWNILLYGLSFSERAYLLIFAKQRDFLLLSAMGYLKWGEITSGYIRKPLAALDDVSKSQKRKEERRKSENHSIASGIDSGLRHGHHRVRRCRKHATFDGPCGNRGQSGGSARISGC